MQQGEEEVTLDKRAVRKDRTGGFKKWAGAITKWQCPLCNWKTKEMEKVSAMQQKAAHVNAWHPEQKAQLSLARKPQIVVRKLSRADKTRATWLCKFCGQGLLENAACSAGRWARVTHAAKMHPGKSLFNDRRL